MKLKRLWLEDIKYGLVFACHPYTLNFSRSQDKHIQRVLFPDSNVERVVDVEALSSGSKVACIDFPENPELIEIIRAKKLLILSYRIIEKVKYSLIDKDVYYYGVEDYKLALCNHETTLTKLQKEFQGVALLNQGELFFYNFHSTKPTSWPNYKDLPKPLANQIRQLLFGCYDHRSHLFRLDPSIFNRIVYWLVQLDNAEQQYEEL